MDETGCTMEGTSRLSAISDLHEHVLDLGPILRGWFSGLGLTGHLSDFIV